MRAYWQGDTRHVSTSDMVPVKVQTAVPANLGGSGNVPNLSQEFSNLAKGWPSASVPFALARSFLALGVVLANLIPGGAPVDGYFVGSLLLGFVFVFPVTSITVRIPRIEVSAVAKRYLAYSIVHYLDRGTRYSSFERVISDGSGGAACSFNNSFGGKQRAATTLGIQHASR